MSRSELLGRAFRLDDGVVRWVVHVSKRGLLHLRWLNENNGVWHYGGRAQASGFEGMITEEVEAPRPGDLIKEATTLGGVQERVIPKEAKL